MATINKTSIREEISQVKADFEKLCAEEKISNELKAIMSSLFMIVELLLSIFLERQTKKSDKNSSIPSSQTGKDDSALPDTGSNGKGKPEDNKTTSNARTKTSITVATVDFCELCGEALSEVPCTHHERRTKIDIVFEKVVEHVDAEVKQCPNCDATVKGAFVADMHGSLQYGDGLKAFAINLLVSQMVALNRIQKLIKAMMGVVIAEATLLKFVLRLHESLEAWEGQAIEEILNMPSMHVDETSLRVDKKRQWIHVYSSGDITLKFLHKKRGKRAIEAIDIIPRYHGAIIHDCWSSYLSYDHCDHGLCGSHLLRELVFVVESNNYAWARNIKRLLQESCAKVSKREEKCLADKELVNLQKRYRNIMTCGEKELPPPHPSPVVSGARLQNRMHTISGSD